jgi:hypothetical protein
VQLPPLALLTSCSGEAGQAGGASARAGLARAGCQHTQLVRNVCRQVRLHGASGHSKPPSRARQLLGRPRTQRARNGVNGRRALTSGQAASPPQVSNAHMTLSVAEQLEEPGIGARADTLLGEGLQVEGTW